MKELAIATTAEIAMRARQLVLQVIHGFEDAQVNQRVIRIVNTTRIAIVANCVNFANLCVKICAGNCECLLASNELRLVVEKVDGILTPPPSDIPIVQPYNYITKST